ncbi:unnamed protein product [Coffea canephora]|uniref:RING-type E3 ubiquitin transferase n=1 Tax=Coffea canephora TaxID=49390 RepID=A0A068TT63_COFCA|nr:unnamed protein product [Coffea canephora]
MAELVPVGTILAVLSNQIIKTAVAAKEVLEKESFKILSKHLFSIQVVLEELQSKKLDDSPATRKALESIESDVKKANNLVEKYKNKGRFYLLIKCRNIVKEVQDITRHIGKSLAALSVANIEVLSGMSEQVNRLQNEMQRAELEASHSQKRVVDKLNQALKDQIQDQEFANDMLKEIARAVGVPVEPAEISKELESFKREKEEAANRKEMAEVFFLEQVIKLLSQADAARNYEEVRNQYFQRLRVIECHDPKEESIQPFKPFICCITGHVMLDPVSLCTGTACERTALEAWFNSGEKTDPETGEILEDCSYRSNLRLRQSIQEWRELNYCVKIRSCKEKLLAEADSSIKEALSCMQELIKESSINKDWISIGGLTEILVSIISPLHDDDANIHQINALNDIVEGNERNKEIFIENQGLYNVIPYLALDSSVAKAAINLLHEVLHDSSGWNTAYCNDLSQQKNAITFLVELLKSPTREVAEKAEAILMKLCDEEENILKAAEVHWYKPLVDRVNEGPASSRMSIVRALLSLELDEDHIKLVGAGVISPLLEMLAESMEVKELSLSALVKLSGIHEIKKLIADAGGVRLILDLMFSSHLRTVIIAKCSEILKNLSSDGDGTKFLVNENGMQLQLEPVITNVLAYQQNLMISDIVRRPALHALLQICQSDAGLVKTAVSASGVSVILPLLDDSNQEIRETAINLLFLFSQHEPQGVVEYLLKPRRLEALVGFLENEDKSDVQMAAAGLLANLPKSEIRLTEKLIDIGGLKAIISILRSESIEAKENALSALFRFTDPTNIQFQHSVVDLGAYPLLVSFLRDASVTTKARAAALLGDLSMRSSELSVMPKIAGCWSILWTRGKICPVHGVVCSVTTTFCLLEANALPELVTLLQGNVHATAYEAIQTLSTLVREESPHRGANVLHENNAIRPLIEVLSWGQESLKAEALGLLEKIFMSKDMVDLYGSTAKVPLFGLTGRSMHEEGHLQRKAARVLLLIDRHSRSSTSLVAGISD